VTFAIVHVTHDAVSDVHGNKNAEQPDDDEDYHHPPRLYHRAATMPSHPLHWCHFSG